MTLPSRDEVVAALVLIAFTIIAAVMLGSLGCARPLPARSALDCRVALIEPYLGELTHDLVREALAGDNTSLVRTLLELGLTPDQVHELAAKWHACGALAPITIDAGVTPS